MINGIDGVRGELRERREAVGLCDLPAAAVVALCSRSGMGYPFSPGSGCLEDEDVLVADEVGALASSERVADVQ